MLLSIIKTRTGILAAALFVVSAVIFVTDEVEASPAETYKKAVALAADGKDSEAVARLNGALDVYAVHDVWRERMQSAEALLSMREQRQPRPRFSGQSPQAGLVEAYLRQHPAPVAESSWMPGIFATLLPGSGHAWLGRWRDAGVAALMVWPMLLLTLWAGKRRMGPLTVFFAMITVWLWSGTVFSAVSLAERGGYESYLAWWQGLWQASGLQGRPW